MSMIDNDEPLSAVCPICEVIAFEPKICAECGLGTERLCSDCRKTCPDCGETVCFDHYSDKAKRCMACQEADRIASGEALAEWKWSGGY